MESLPFIAGGLLVASLVGVIVWQRALIRSLETSQEKVVTEEARVFDFLHGLGEALSATARSSDLHGLIVKGLLRILRSQSGALYIANDSNSALHPAFVAKGCPPLVDLVGEPDMDEEAVHRQLRIRNVKKGEGVLAEVWQTEKAQVLGSDDPRLISGRRGGVGAGNVAIVPLSYSGCCFGVFLLARAPADEPFTEPDMQVFQTLAEHSAFTLRTAEAFSDAAEKRRLDNDLQVAHEIQKILLPSSDPSFDGFEIAGRTCPPDMSAAIITISCVWMMTAVEWSSLMFLEKGVPASLIMATCRSVLRSQAPGEKSAAEVLKNVNVRLFPDIKEDMFISMAYVVLERNSPSITLCRAGHDAPFLYRASDASVTRVNPPGMAVGIDSGEAFNRFTRDFSLEMHPNDCLVLYTDGVTEALDSKGEEFGMERMTQAIMKGAPRGASAILEQLTADLKEFVGEAPQHDDITLIVIRKK